MRSRNLFSLSTLFEGPMAKGFVCSLLLHLLLVVLLLSLSGGSRRDFLPITVLLAGDLPGEAGGDGKTFSSHPTGSKSTKDKRNTGKLPHRTTEAVSKAAMPEKLASVAGTDKATALPALPMGIGSEPSPSRETGMGRGEMAGAGQGPGDQGGQGETGSDGTGVGSDTGFASGSGSGHGTGGDSNASYLSASFRYIRDRILRRLTYPAEARRMGWKGRVLISFVVSDSGCLENIRVVESSGHEILDAHAVKIIRNCQPFPKPPVRAEVVIPIVFKIG